MKDIVAAMTVMKWTDESKDRDAVYTMARATPAGAITDSTAFPQSKSGICQTAMMLEWRRLVGYLWTHTTHRGDGS